VSSCSPRSPHVPPSFPPPFSALWTRAEYIFLLFFFHIIFNVAELAIIHSTV
jgi:hypothetical protein